jgi:hypothetical protein
MEHVVVYTPLENFFYNTPLGAIVIASFFTVLASTIVGMLVAEMFRRRGSYKLETTSIVAGTSAGILCFLTISYLVFVS